jgi:hypothetical protein
MGPAVLTRSARNEAIALFAEPLYAAAPRNNRSAKERT